MNDASPPLGSEQNRPREEYRSPRYLLKCEIKDHSLPGSLDSQKPFLCCTNLALVACTCVVGDQSPPLLRPFERATVNEERQSTQQEWPVLHTRVSHLMTMSYERGVHLRPETMGSRGHGFRPHSQQALSGIVATLDRSPLLNSQQKSYGLHSSHPDPPNVFSGPARQQALLSCRTWHVSN